MPLLDLQQRAREVGRIRIGRQVRYVKDGQEKSRPEKLDRFRFTTNDPHAAQRVAELYGGEAIEWEGGRQAWEVIADVSELDVMVPPGEAALSQDYELWSGGGLQRRCDGINQLTVDQVCVCPRDIGDRMEAAAQGRACKPTTRVNVILPDLPDIGVWRYESHGYTAALELGGTADLLARAREKGVVLPAKMRMEARQKISGGQTRNWFVVVLSTSVTLRELIEGTYTGGLAQALPPPPASVKQIEAPKDRPAPEPAAGAPAAPPSGQGGSRTGRQAAHTPAVQIPTTAQGIADEARTCVDLTRLGLLFKAARENGWSQELVTDPDDILEPLDDVILSRKTELESGAA
jgi:hypothetical protein